MKTWKEGIGEGQVAREGFLKCSGAICIVKVQILGKPSLISYFPHPISKNRLNPPAQSPNSP